MARISIVDDNSEVRKVIRMILEIDGHEVREFESGQDFLEKLGTGEWLDLILLDVMMPEIDGWAVSRKIKTEIDRNIPICILTTKKTDLDNRMSLEAAKADVHLNKPISIKTLLETVDQLLSLRSIDNKKSIERAKVIFDQ